jgi:hypothetical protein
MSNSAMPVPPSVGRWSTRAAHIIPVVVAYHSIHALEAGISADDVIAPPNVLEPFAAPRSPGPLTDQYAAK